MAEKMSEEEARIVADLEKSGSIERTVQTPKGRTKTTKAEFEEDSESESEQEAERKFTTDIKGRK